MSQVKNLKKTPQNILEKGVNHTTPRAIANSLNRQFIQRINKLIQNMPNPIEDPMVNYKKLFGQVEHQLKFKTINMHQLTLVLQ